MESSETLQTLYTAPVEQSDGTYQISVPDREIASGTLADGETYRIAVISTPTSHTETTAPDSDHGAEYDEQQPQADSRPLRKANAATSKSSTSVTRATGSRKLNAAML